MFTGSSFARAAGALSLACLGVLVCRAGGQTQSPLVDRVGATGFLQLNADSFRNLSPREQEVAYWLSQAAIAIHPIIFDQQSRFGLRQKRVLEMMVSHQAISVRSGLRADDDGQDPAWRARYLASQR